MHCIKKEKKIKYMNWSVDIFARGVQRNINIVTFVLIEIVAMQMDIL